MRCGFKTFASRAMRFCHAPHVPRLPNSRQAHRRDLFGRRDSANALMVDVKMAMSLAAVRTSAARSSLPSMIRWRARSDCRSCSRRRVCDLTLKVEDTLFDCLAQVTSELRSQGHHLHPGLLPGRRRLLDRGSRDQRERALVPGQRPPLAAGQRSPLRVLARRGGDVPAPRDRPRHQLRLRAVEAQGLDADLRRVPAALPRRLQLESLEPRLRPLPAPRRQYHYAQKHPDEDFAETFAVWLDPASRWRRRYKDWQVALAKLEYVDRIVDVEGACRGTPPNQRVGTRVGLRDASRRPSPTTSTSPTRSIPIWPSTAATSSRSSRAVPSPHAARRERSPPHASSSSTSACSSTRSAAGSASPTAG